MNPTMKLRLVERPYTEPGSPEVCLIVKIWQQWWVNDLFGSVSYQIGKGEVKRFAYGEGEWRDVPIEVES